MRDYDDKRNFFRMMVNSTCELLIEDGSNRTMNAVCKDLSATGMSLETDDEVGANVQMTVSIESSGSQIPALTAKVRVVRCTATTDSTYIVGVEIIEMT